MKIEQHLKQIEQILYGFKGVVGVGAILTEMSAIRQGLTAQAEQSKHEGWSNYETQGCWNGIVNDKELHQYLVAIADELEPYDFDADLTTGIINRINFTEIAERLIAEAKNGGVE